MNKNKILLTVSMFFTFSLLQSHAKSIDPIGNNLTGNWCNELGSQAIIEQDSTGRLSGNYTTAVGNAGGWYRLTGFTNLAGSATHAVVGMTVLWKNEHKGDSESITTWNGLYHNRDGQESIQAHWLLTRKTEAKNSWNSTLINTNYFTRCASFFSENQENQPTKSEL